jgi:hypothetical protein
MTWKLNRTVQCGKCPWRKDVDPYDIPNGYDVEKHRALKSTISDGGLGSVFSSRMHVMACHESHKDYCLGWLMNQLGPGNNIALRMRMSSCENGRDIRLIGEQHETFEDTLPD